MHKRATILCYHKVGPESEEGRRLNIAPARLASHVRFFHRRGHPFRLARDLDKPWDPGLVCFTFDDAYESALANAPEIFERLGVRATFYAVTSQVGGASVWDGEAARPLADWPTLLDAQARGHEIGNHTVSHPHLSELSAEDQLAEISGASVALLERGFVPGSFCYPYGSLNPGSISAARAAGHRVGVALNKRQASTEEDPLALSRIVVAFSHSLPLLLYRIHIRPLLSGRRGAR